MRKGVHVAERRARTPVCGAFVSLYADNMKRATTVKLQSVK